ncbi:uncharacterized protein L201_006509 [Kwoniella dendrophila CBS 6074]|uniref:[RNA-polymerase]-subunit kinase n=1 Tax=Kwoniella dendrophila CBS 6074 TaxID=1295534 RepID=A0AAX4K384_9TREE
MSDQSYSFSRPLSPPMPSYEPLSTASSSSTANPYPRHNHMPVKRESWRPGQPSSSTLASTSAQASLSGQNIPTGPASHNAWRDSARPSESYDAPNESHNNITTNSNRYGREASRSRSPISRRDASPSSSQGGHGDHAISRSRKDQDYDMDDKDDRDTDNNEKAIMNRDRDYQDRRREFDRRRDVDNINDTDRDRDRGWKRDRKRKNFGGHGHHGGFDNRSIRNNNGFNNQGNNNNFNRNRYQPHGNNDENRSWAAWNEKVQTVNRIDDQERTRDNDRIANRRREFDRNNRRDDRDFRDERSNRDRDHQQDDNNIRDSRREDNRAQSPSSSVRDRTDDNDDVSQDKHNNDINSNRGDIQNDERSWSAWKAKVDEKEKEDKLEDSWRDQRLENAKKEGFWTGGHNRHNQNQRQNQYQNNNQSRFQHQQQNQQQRRWDNYNNRKFQHDDNDNTDRDRINARNDRRGRRDSPDYGGISESNYRSDNEQSNLSLTNRRESLNHDIASNSKTDQVRRNSIRGRDSPDYGEPSNSRIDNRLRENPSVPATSRGGRESPDYGVGGKSGDRSRSRSRSASPPTNDRKRAPSSPRASENKRLRDLSPARSRRDSPSPPPKNRWGRHSRQSPEERQRQNQRDRSPPSGPRVRNASPSQNTAIGRRQPLPPQGQTFMSGANNRPHWGDRNNQRDGGPSQRRWGRADSNDDRAASREYNAATRQLEASGNGVQQDREENGKGYDSNEYSYAQMQNQHLQRPPPPQHSPYSSKPPPPPSDVLPYGSPPPPPAIKQSPRNTSITIPEAHQDIKSASLLALPVKSEPITTGSIKISFNTSPKKGGWKPISPVKTIQNLFEEETASPSQSDSINQPNPPPPPAESVQISPHQLLRHTNNPPNSEPPRPPHPGPPPPITIAPYIKAAFSQWSDNNMQPPIEIFLDHYFGRDPTIQEFEQIDMLVDIEISKKAELEKEQSRNRGEMTNIQHTHVDPRTDERFARDRDGDRDFNNRHNHREQLGLGYGRDHRNDRELNRGRSSSTSNGNSFNDIPVVQSRWAPQANTPDVAHRPSGELDQRDVDIRLPASSAFLPQSDSYPEIPSFRNRQSHNTDSQRPSATQNFHPPDQSQLENLLKQVGQIQHIQSQPKEQPISSSFASVPEPKVESAKKHSSYTPTTSGEMYTLLSHVGEGTYGKVYKARNTDTGVMVALKKIRLEGEKDGFPVTAMREIKLLQGLKHNNVVRLLEIMVSKGSVHMVFEYMDHDLTGLLSHPTLKFSEANIKALNYQMLDGLKYLHLKNILHRDMKGSNILLNAKGELKLADFGLARLYSKRVKDYTNRVITLWYRSPELLMGETVYGPEVDMWSAGCITLEIFLTKPIFQGTDEINQLEVIYNIMGTPKESQWPGVKDLPWYELVKPKNVIESKFKSSFEKWLSPAALDLVEGLLHFDPSGRLSAEESMKTPYFVSEEPPMEIPTQLAGMGEHHEMSAKQDRQRRRQMEGR